MSDIVEKLVRDRIPEIIERQGRVPDVRVADPDEYHILLRAKLLEEVGEFLEAESVEEMADVLEVLRAMAHLHGWGESAVEEVREAKARERGGFEHAFVLRMKTC